MEPTEREVGKSVEVVHEVEEATVLVMSEVLPSIPTEAKTETAGEGGRPTETSPVPEIVCLRCSRRCES